MVTIEMDQLAIAVAAAVREGLKPPALTRSQRIKNWLFTFKVLDPVHFGSDRCGLPRVLADPHMAFW